MRVRPGFGPGDALALAVVVLCGVASVVVLSIYFDGVLAARAAAQPTEAVSWGLFVSALASVRPIYLGATALAGGALLLRGLVPMARRRRAALRLIAERAVFVMAALGAAQAVTQTLKFTLGRARPRLLLDTPYHFEWLALRNDYASFPSGHATTAFAMAFSLSLLLPGLRAALYALAVAVALARIVVGAHFLSDIATGAVVGTVGAWLVARAFADRAIAFTRAGEGVRLKGAGLVRAALLGPSRPRA